MSKIKLLNDGHYGDADNVNFPAEVKAKAVRDIGFFVLESELVRVGFELINPKNNIGLFFSNNEVEVISNA